MAMNTTENAINIYEVIQIVNKRNVVNKIQVLWKTWLTDRLMRSSPLKSISIILPQLIGC